MCIQFLYGITTGFSPNIVKKYKSKVAGNIGHEVRTMIPRIGTGNPGIILSGCVENWVSMILQSGTSSVSIWGGSWIASVRFYMTSWNCERRL